MGDPAGVGKISGPSYSPPQSGSIEDTFLDKLHAPPPYDRLQLTKDFFQQLSASDAKELLDTLQGLNDVSVQFNGEFDAIGRSQLLGILQDKLGILPAPSSPAEQPQQAIDPKATGALKQELGISGSMREAQLRSMLADQTSDKNLAALKGDQNFKHLDRAVQKEVLAMWDQFDHGASVDQARENLRQLVTDPTFKQLPPDAQKLALKNLATKPDNGANLSNIKAGMKTYLGLQQNENFHRLDPDIQKAALGLVLNNEMNAGTREQLVKFLLTPDLKNPQAAVGLTAGLPFSTLKEMNSTPGGERLFQQISEQVKASGPSGAAQAMRIDTARAAFNVEQMPEFQKLGSTTKEKIRAAFEKSQNDPQMAAAISKSTVAILMSSLPDVTNTAIIDAVLNKGRDPAFLKGVTVALTIDSDFMSLSGPQQTQVIRDMSKFTETESYKKMSDQDKGAALEIIRNLSIYTAQNPSNAIDRNTLNHMLDGSVNVGIERKEPTQSGSDAGKVDITGGEADREKNLMLFNVSDPFIRISKENLMEVAAHEVNHLLNGDTPAGTPSRFLDEYRAWFTGFAAIGQNPPSVDMIRDQLKYLAAGPPDGSGYDHIRKLYRDNPEFKQVVDQMIRDLNATPPKITNPEELRVKMNNIFHRTDFSGTGPGAGYDRVLYLDTPGNVDNR